MGGFGGGFSANSDPSGSPLAMALIGIWGLFLLASFIPIVAVNVRRLHDRNMSGWWYLGFMIMGWIPLIGFVTGFVYIVLMALPGTDGPNKYGEDPKEPGNADVFA